MTSDREAPRPDDAGPTAEGIVARPERQRVRAYVERDLATLDRLLPTDFVFTRSLGRAFNKRQPVGALSSGELTLSGYERKVRKLTVVNNTAVAVGHDRARGSYQGRDIGGDYHFGSIYVENAGGWRVAVAHAYRLDNDPAQG